ncbi:MAG: hypothetical protein ACM3OC_03005 [Deltaproteobacteria bacterium]
MAKRSWIILLVAVVAGACMWKPGYCQADAANSTSGKPELKWITGTVSQVAFAKSFLLVITEKGYLKFDVKDDETVIRIGGEKADLSEIDPEDSVRIQYYSPKPGQYTAVFVSMSRKSYSE